MIASEHPLDHETALDSEAADAQHQEKTQPKAPLSGTSLKELEEVADPEEKLKKAMELMRTALAQPGHADFKTFWDAGKVCLALFKANIAPPVKAVYWSTYRDLTKEAKKLKDLFEEQSAFAAEQIDIAISAMEAEIRELSTASSKGLVPELSEDVEAIRDNYARYVAIQQELNILNAHAARINALRKEVIRTEMRIRHKNLFFKRLSSAGDLVFPRRKELIQEISDLFMRDVDAYMQLQEKRKTDDKSFFEQREEIKKLQAAAKILTLNSHAFTHARLKLSQQWDKLKEAEKDKKKFFAEKRHLQKNNAGEVRAKIQALSDAFRENRVTPLEAQKQVEEIQTFMRTVELSREDVPLLKDELNQVFKPVKDKMKEEEKKRRDKESEKEQHRKDKVRTIEERLKAVEAGLPQAEFTTVSQEIDEISKDIDALKLSEPERILFDILLAPIRDALIETEQAEILRQEGDAEQILEKLEDLLEKMKVRRAEIKEQMEKYRKACGGSGLDFEQSMLFDKRLAAEKKRFDSINVSIANLESKLDELY